MNFFENIELLPSDPILGLTAAYAADKRKQKANLGAGVYKTADLQPLVLETVKEAERWLLENEKSKDYLPIDGDPQYVSLTRELVFASTSHSEKIYGAQTVGGTAALRIGATFLKRQGYSHIMMPSPTWVNHKNIFNNVGLRVEEYPYYCSKKHFFNFKAFCEYLHLAEENSPILFHACCHNPTGIDPTDEEWQTIAELVSKKKLLPFFDCAYQGFGRGLEKDAAVIRLFLEKGLEFLVSVSHSKNFGLYAERTGAIFFVTASSSFVAPLKSQVHQITRSLYSSPPCHGARIVTRILENDDLRCRWINELETMRLRISEMRQALVSKLQEKTEAFTFMKKQQGMFSYTDLGDDKVKILINDYGIYLPRDGRINVAGLNEENLDYVADAIAKVCSR